jgi:hypothetical protein
VLQTEKLPELGVLQTERKAMTNQRTKYAWYDVGVRIIPKSKVSSEKDTEQGLCWVQLGNACSNLIPAHTNAELRPMDS